jgi:signal transduction histidine kinase
MHSSVHQSIARRTVLGIAGLALGGAIAVIEVAYLLFALPALVVPAARARVYAGALRFAEIDRDRVARFFGVMADVGDPGGPRAIRYLAVRTVLGLLGFGEFVLLGFGMFTAAIAAWQIVTGQPIGGGTGNPTTVVEVVGVILIGSLLLFVVVSGLAGVAILERMMVPYFLGPRREELLRQRVSELATTRAGVVEAVNEERRRIERDLHDGVQQRLVALGMLLGRARRAADRERVDELVRLAHVEAQQSLGDLREVTWRVYPIALDQGGLATALESVAERSSVPVRLTCELLERPDLATETVAYFVVSEAVTNAIKHGSPGGIDISVRRDDSWLMVDVCDDGSGGALPTGTGLSGLARRVAAADGEFTVDSPPGGPTVVSARLPCG